MILHLLMVFFMAGRLLCPLTVRWFAMRFLNTLVRSSRPPAPAADLTAANVLPSQSGPIPVSGSPLKIVKNDLQFHWPKTHRKAGESRVSLRSIGTFDFKVRLIFVSWPDLV